MIALWEHLKLNFSWPGWSTHISRTRLSMFNSRSIGIVLLSNEQKLGPHKLEQLGMIHQVLFQQVDNSSSNPIMCSPTSYL